MSVVLDPGDGPRWVAQPRQAEFLVRTEDEVLYGGAAGGGKTDALLAHAIFTCLAHPGARVLFLRRTFADLGQPGAAMDRAQQLLRGHADWHGQAHRWTFQSGGVLQFGHLQHPADVYNFQGAQFDSLIWDELTQFTFEQYQFLRSRVRATVPGLKTTIRAATNPGGVGHAWVRQRWIDAAPWGTPFELRPGVTGCFVPAKVTDNRVLLRRDPEYATRLRELPVALRRAYLEGDWDHFAGQVFSQFRREVHVCAPFQVPPEWPRWRAVDYGYHAPMCCLWAARAPSGEVYVYRELYATGLTDVAQARRIAELSGTEPIRATFGDPSMWNTQPNGTSVARVYAQWGVPLAPANNNRLAGWQQVHQALAWDARQPRPRLRIFSTCANLLRTLPALVYDATNVEDVDTDGEDHAADGLRYLLMGLAVSPQRLLPRTTTYALGGRVAPERWDPFADV